MTKGFSTTDIRVVLVSSSRPNPNIHGEALRQRQNLDIMIKLKDVI